MKHAKPVRFIEFEKHPMFGHTMIVPVEIYCETVPGYVASVLDVYKIKYFVFDESHIEKKWIFSRRVKEWSRQHPLHRHKSNCDICKRNKQIWKTTPPPRDEILFKGQDDERD